MTIFIDASAAVSYFDVKDINHVRTLKISNQFGKNKIITSNYVFAEIVTIVSQNAGKEVAIDAGNYIKDNFSVIRIPIGIEDLAWDIFKIQTSKNVGFVDCSTIALFQKGIFDKVFTFDSDFKKNKVVILE